uniref:Uncharacterized protein n=1 Tax=Haptolina brevifila TaxID=156173 RepID=A0A7S2MC83_9EUKA|mmetsp:Transcript_4909/g.10404  ORF Transcript_4909/g.10404 Transcript_4909/m.10404 type:complete len:278 (+) Transcript_4909:692-1525(+)
MRTALSLTQSQHVKLHDSASGKRWVQRGPALLVPEPTWEVDGGVRTAISLSSMQYVRLIDQASGAIRVEKGEQMVFLTATESILNDEGVLTAINLKVFQYVKILDNATGNIRVVKGVATVFLGPTEDTLGKGKVDAVEIDTDTAVSVRSKRTGELRLVTAEIMTEGGAKSALFFPKPEENIVEVQKLIKLADYEAMIMVNASGQMTFYYGDDEKRGERPRAFFVPPHHSIHTLCWSRGRRREKRNLNIDRLDCRPQFMSFEFNTRTSDNGKAGATCT